MENREFGRGKTKNLKHRGTEDTEKAESRKQKAEGRKQRAEGREEGRREGGKEVDLRRRVT
jgi:hypothetical protein